MKLRKIGLSLGLALFGVAGLQAGSAHPVSDSPEVSSFVNRLALSLYKIYLDAALQASRESQAQRGVLEDVDWKGARTVKDKKKKKTKKERRKKRVKQDPYEQDTFMGVDWKNVYPIFEKKDKKERRKKEVKQAPYEQDAFMGVDWKNVYPIFEKKDKKERRKKEVKQAPYEQDAFMGVDWKNVYPIFEKKDKRR